MKKRFTLALAVWCIAACSSMPDGIADDAFAPYSPVSRTLQCNTGRGLGTAAFNANNDCLYYEFEYRDDDNAAGTYQRVSETRAHVLIRSDDDYETEYILDFESPNNGKVEELYMKDNCTEKFLGTFTLQ